MNRSLLALACAAALLCSLLLAVTPLAAAPLQQTGGTELFLARSMQGDPAQDDPLTQRARFVDVNFSQLGGLARPVGSVDPVSDQVVLNLFDDASYVGVLDRTEKTERGYAWVGHLQGMPTSQVTLVVQDEGLLVGNIVSPDRLFAVRYAGGVHTIAELDPGGFAEELPPIIPADQGPMTRQSTAAVGDGSVIDVMVLYSTKARTSVGGVPAIEALVDLAISETNATYANSGIDQRVDLVYMGEVSDAADEFSPDLAAIRSTTDGVMDDVHNLRTEYHADEVALIIDNNASCGLGYLMTNVSTGFATSAFVVVDFRCATGYFSLAHEWGHNMGARHDWYVDDTRTYSPYPYAKGFVNDTALWRTVMAYNTLCTDQGFNCTRLPYWSNPSVAYVGSPTGVSIGTSTSCTEGQLSPHPSTCDADNRTTLNNTAATVDQFRSSLNTWQGTDSNWAATGNWSLGVVPRSFDDVLVPASAAAFPTITGDAIVRRLEIQAGAALAQTGGTLGVRGDWVNGGTFASTGGTVAFVGHLDRTISTGGDAFNHLQIGDGTSSMRAILGADLEIDGDLFIAAGASLAAGSHTIRVAGNWTGYDATSFEAGTGTVVFDGAAQNVSMLHASMLAVSQDFSAYDGSNDGSFTTTPPAGWTVAQAGDGDTPYYTWWFGRDSIWNPAGGGMALRWKPSPAVIAATHINAWLFTPSLALHGNALYVLQFRYRVASSADPQDLAVHLGSSPAAAGMSQQVWGLAGASSTSWLTVTESFQVDADGTYYLGFQNYDGSPGTYGAMLDDITLAAYRCLGFHNLVIGGTGDVTVDTHVEVGDSITVSSGSALSLGLSGLNVEEILTNNGIVRQTRQTPGGQTTSFLSVTNLAGDATKYHGVDITPATAGMGLTTVSVQGGETCAGAGGMPLLSRCYWVEPGTAETAALRFWYSEAERNGQSANALELWHYSGVNSAWEQAGDAYQFSETGTACESEGGSACWFQASNISSYSPFAVGGDVPTGSGPVFGVSKMADTSGVAGTPITYTLAVENTGTLTGTNVTLSDTVPGALVSITTDGTYDGTDVTWTFTEIAPNPPGAISDGWFAAMLPCATGDVVNDTYMVVDSVEGVGSDPGASVTVDVQAPTMAASLVNSGPAVVSQTVLFTATAGSSGTPLSYVWDFGASPVAGDLTASHIFNTIGNHTVVFTATDECGYTVTAQTVVIVTPVCSAVTAVDFVYAPLEPTVRDTVVYTVSVTPVGATAPMTCTWTFGDGSSETVQAPTIVHTYLSTGTMPVQVTVYNPCTSVGALRQKTLTIAPLAVYLPVVLRSTVP